LNMGLDPLKLCASPGLTRCDFTMNCRAISPGPILLGLIIGLVIVSIAVFLAVIIYRRRVARSIYVAIPNDS